jgi:hypothetical protein
MRARVFAAAVAGLLAARCNLVLGIEVLPTKEDAGHGGAGGGTTGSTTTTTTTCAASLTNCSGDCVDLTSDPQHCGACGHDCMGGLCTASKCQPHPIVTGLNAPIDIALSGDTAYFAHSGTGEIVKVALPGGQTTVVATGQGHATGIAIAGGYVHWSTFEGAIGSISTAGGAPIAVASGQGQLLAVGADADNVYWFTGTSLMKSAAGKAAPQAVMGPTASQASGFGIEIASGSILWADGAGTGAVRAMPLPTGAVTELATGEAWPNDVASYGGTIYWVDGSGPVMAKPSGGAATKLADGGKNLQRVAVDADFVYWTAADDNAVERVPRGGGAVEVLTTAATQAHGIALDAKRVVWTARGAGTNDGTVWILAK